MSNYNLQVSWSGKDALSDSDSDKVISGGDFNTEFTAVKTAVNSKAELNGSASETFSAVTAASGTSTTQVATTAFVASATTVAYPVGAIFTTVTAYANSAAVVTAIGGTTWVAFAAGKVLVGLDSGDTDFDTVEETGGSKTHTLSTSEMPAHTHTYKDQSQVYDGTGGTATNPSPSGWGQEKPTGSTGGGSAHNNVQPYIVVYFWKRTA